jgi:hypothetical protein
LEEVTMRRMGTRWVILAAIVSIVGCAGASANNLGFSANIGLEITYTPVPPASFNIGSDLMLAFDVSGFSFASTTGFDLLGFRSERVTLVVDLGAVQIGERIRFEPTFSRNELSLDLSIVGVQIGVDWILADIGGVQTPTYSMGAVVNLSSGIVCGFSIRSLTGFGAIDLVNDLGGIEAPFSHDLLYLFHHLATFCAPAIDLDVTIVDGFYFEEELVRLEVDYLGLIASNTTWFDYMGLSRLLFELGYRFAEPSLSFLATMTLDGSFAIIGLEFVVDLQIEVVRFTSHTTFAEPTVPSPIPIVFSGQGFAVSFEICGVTITSETDFDDSFFFSQELIGIEAQIDPVTFKSLTGFDAFGFASQCVYAEVTFSGIVLYTKAIFDFTGIQEVTFGFELSF